MAFNTRSVIIAVANLFALFVVVGFYAQGFMGAGSEETPLVAQAVAEPVMQQVDEIPLAANMNRQARAKGYKGKSKSAEESDCVPLYPTPSPVKSSKGKGSRKLGRGKGKGSTAAPVSQDSQILCLELVSLYIVSDLLLPY